MRSVLVTGASGFIGQSLCHVLMKLNYSAGGSVRSLHSATPASGIEPVAVGNLDAATDLSSALAGVACVIHCAAAGQTMLVSDGEDVSTPDLLSHIAAGSGRSVRLLSVPVSL